MPIVPILGLIFVTLKLTGYIAWSWLWVLAPFWIGAAVFLFIMSLGIIGLGVVGGIAALQPHSRMARR